MMPFNRFLAIVLAALVAHAAAGDAADIGVGGSALRVTNRGASQRVRLDIRDPAITKGPGATGRTTVPSLEATVAIYYADQPGALSARFQLPAGLWRNRGEVARLNNGRAPAGPTATRRAVIRNGRLLSFSALALGDDRVAQLGSVAPTATGGINVVVTLRNALDGSTTRLCTRFATAAGSAVSFASTPGRQQLTARGGVADDCLAEIPLTHPAECDPLNDAECMLPYPSSHFLTPASTDTGYRLNLPQAGVPHVNGPPVSVAPYNTLDGFSTAAQVLMHFPQRVDPVRTDAARLLPPLCCGQPAGPPWVDTRTYTDRSLDADSPTILLDVTTGTRVLHFIEPDARVTGDEAQQHQLLFLRPARILDPNHHYVVALRRLISPSGAPVTAEPAFAALRDGIATDVPSIEARRAAMETTVFAPLAAAGIDRASLVLAFDFHTRSEAQSSQLVRSMRDQAFAWLDTVDADPQATPFTVTRVQENDCSSPGAFIWRRIRGSYQSPLFLLGDLNNNTAPFPSIDADGNGVQNGFTNANFTITLPCSLFDPTAEQRQFLFGHGLFQTGDEISDLIPPVVNAVTRWTAITAATDWRGLSSPDLAWVGNQIIGTSTSQLNNFPAFPGRLRQGLSNTLVLARLMKRGVFNRHPAFQFEGGQGVFPGPTEDLYYYGISLGGIMGAYTAALTPDIERYVLDVPAVNFSCMLQRASPFAPFDALLGLIGITDPLNAALGVQLTHELWFSAEPASVIHHVTSDPYPGSGPAKKILYTEAFLDKQVSNQCTEIAARTMGLSNLAGSIRTQLVGIPDAAGPLDSAFVSWDAGELDILNPAHAPYIPPLANQIPSGVCDPHPRRPTPADAVLQIAEFLRPGGTIRNFCDGLCDAGTPDERPRPGCTPP
jgi:hypothetical protein